MPMFQRGSGLVGIMIFMIEFLNLPAIAKPRIFYFSKNTAKIKYDFDGWRFGKAIIREPMEFQLSGRK